MTPEIERAKAEILKARRQRIRKSTYIYVTDRIVEDTRYDNPFRDRMVIDWWARVLDPLDAEEFDRGRLDYFRKRLKEHKRAPRINAEIRQGKQKGNQLRRLNPNKLAYIDIQTKRLSDPKLNYAAARKAVETSGTAYEQLTIGLFSLARFEPRKSEGVLFFASEVAAKDARFPKLLEKLRSDRALYLPELTETCFERRVEIITNPGNEKWYVPITSLKEIMESGLIRKLEEKYIK